MFRHEQTSDLVLYSQQRRLDSYVHVQPKHLDRGEDGHSAPLDLLSGLGSFAISLPGAPAQRLSLRGVVEIGDGQQLQRIELTANLHQARQTGMGMTIFLEGRPARDDWHYIVKEAGVVVREDKGPLDHLIRAADPHLPGLDLSGLPGMWQQQGGGTFCSAHRGWLRLPGEAIDSYVVTLQHGATLESTIYFNQLGQILAVKTFAGYDLYDEGIAP